MEVSKTTDKRKPDSLPKWIKCSEQMPPVTLKIITKINGRLVGNAGQGVMLSIFLDYRDMDWSCVEWTPYTEDVWNELSKKELFFTVKVNHKTLVKITAEYVHIIGDSYLEDKIHLVFDPLLNCAREILDLVDSGHFESNITIDE